jgi:hypothetical protein
MPSVLAVAGVDGPAMDGRDLCLSVEDGGYPVVFSESNGFIAATDGRYKYAHYCRDGETRTELYDMETDPREFHNQARNPAHAEPLARMRGAVIEHLIEHSLPNRST